MLVKVVRTHTSNCCKQPIRSLQYTSPASSSFNYTPSSYHLHLLGLSLALHYLCTDMDMRLHPELTNQTSLPTSGVSMLLQSMLF